MIDDIFWRDATDLQRLIRARELSAVEVTRAHIGRIESVNPAINAFVTTTFDAALEQAAALDARLGRGEDPGPLAGIPVGHKDLAVTRGVRTTFGSPIFRDHVPTVDAVIVERLKAAGAVTLGKTNTPEFGAGSQTFNPVFGATRNPWDMGKTPGGSSGGAAAALAAGMIPIADGSDLGGSLRNPASFCNVVGLRPSPGRVPNWPTLNAWFPLGVVGPMARTVADVALMLSAIAGPDPRSDLAWDEPGSIFAQPLGRDFTGVRVAWTADFGGLPMDPEVREVLAASRATLESLGCAVDEALPDLAGADEVFQTLRAWIFESTHGALLAQHRDQMKQTVIWNIEQGQRLTGADVARAERLRTELFHRLRAFFERYDFVAGPVVQVLPFDVSVEYPMSIDGVAMGSYIEWMKSCYLVSATGLPALSVPAGFSRGGLPVGLQLIGRHRDDLGVLQLGHAFEQATGFGRQRPPAIPAPV